ncbi:hypothetical protein [Afipia carboxidovorans]|uniref:hypothetical protein n=1 Tax=Afipia carboxidovorans TaxID=40137 RepID=UPI0030D2D728
MQTVDIGQAANDGSGDWLRDAFNKINQNFSEVYASLAFTAGGLAKLLVWQTLQIYEVGQLVSHGDGIWRCTVRHGSGSFDDDLAAGKWMRVATLPQGLPGIDGNTILYDSGPPNDDIGKNGDLYFDVTAITIYGPKSVTWPSGMRLPAPSYGGTSATSLAIGTGSRVFATQEHLAYQNGARVRATSQSDPTKWMEGVAAYAGVTLTLDVDKVNGAGTFADWNLNLAGEPGKDGLNGQMSGPIASDDGEIVLFSGTDGATVKRAAGSGMVQVSDGVFGLATPGSDFVKPDTPSAFSKQQSYTLEALTDGTTINWDVSGAQKAKVTLGGNRTMNAVTNAVEGTTYLLWVIQDGTGSRTLSWTTTGSGSFDFGADGVPVLTTAANKADQLAFEALSIGGVLKLRYAGIRRGYS